jgi:hypothetical protein
MMMVLKFMGAAMEHRAPKNTTRLVPQVSSRMAISELE